MLTVANAQGIQLQAKLFRDFSDPSRLSILYTVRKGRRTVGEIVETTSLSQSNVSNHLGCLRDCGLVSSQQKGRFVRYQLSDKQVDQLLGLADELLAEVARGVYQCVHYNADEEK